MEDKDLTPTPRSGLAYSNMEWRFITVIRVLSIAQNNSF